MFDRQVQVKKGVKCMSAETNKSQFCCIYEEMFNKGDLTIVNDLVAPDCINYEMPPGKNNRGPEAGQEIVMMLRVAFPDLHFTIEELVTEGDTVAGRVTMSGTH